MAEVRSMPDQGVQWQSGAVVLLAVAMISSMLAGCGREPYSGPAGGEDGVTWLVQRHLPEGMQPDAILAQGGPVAITALQVAYCLEMQPVRTPGECLELLVDAALVDAHATDDDRERPEVADARRSAMASMALGQIIDRPLADDRLGEEELVRFIEDPANRLMFEAPEMRECSHLLIVTPPERLAQARALADRISDENDLSLTTSVDELRALRSRYSEAAREVSLELRVEAHLLFGPEVPEGSEPWPLVPQAVPEFTRALFQLSAPGDVSGPIQTSYGLHFILLERIHPARRLSPEQAHELARRELGQRRRVLALQSLLTDLEARAEIIRHPQAIDILWQDQEAVLRQQSSTLIDALQTE